MNVCVVTDSSNFLKRALFAAEHYLEQGHEVTLILSDFDHVSKKRIKESELKLDTPGLSHILIDAVPYYKNISASRLYYHRDFAKKAFRSIMTLSPGLIYAVCPSDSVAAMGAKAAEKTKAKLIIDVLDLWPESLPLGKIKNSFPFRRWKRLRDTALSAADAVITECGLYREVLGLKDAKVMYWFKDNFPPLPEDISESKESFRAAYLGAINNIIDIDKIVSVLLRLKEERPLSLDIIGDGERKDEFLGALSLSGIDFTYHGAVYDEDAKQKILYRTDWGLNIMKPAVCVGLTMKSIDYMAAGLKLINNIPGDTASLIERYGIGVNIDKEETPYKELADKSRVWEKARELFGREAAQKVLNEIDRKIGLR